MKNRQKSAPQRLLWAQFDALQMGSGWDEEDVTKPQILLEDVLKERVVKSCKEEQLRFY